MYCINQFGKYYCNGSSYPQLLREEVLDYSHNGLSQRAIAQELRTSRCFVKNVLNHYDKTGTANKPEKHNPERMIMTKDAVDCVEIENLMKPSVSTKEIQDRLLLDGVVFPWQLPSKSAITKCMREDLKMTKKKIQQVPLESFRDDNIQKRNDFLEVMSDLNAATVHCFDESSVVKTTSNRRYGNAPCGQAAIEIQRYASNATYTINLLHSPYGVDFVEILDGPSNGQKLLLYFEEVLNVTKPDGSAVLERGDTVIMDNCGFHHGHFVEPILTAMLNDCGVSLVFQPPYSPEFNTCELCFNEIKSYLQRNQRLAEENTEYAIFLACEEISQQKSINYFRHCGYLL